MKLTNAKMDEYYNSLTGISDKIVGRLGYAVARNIRKLSEELVEYHALKEKAIIKFGTVDESGQARILIGSDAYNEFVEEMNEYIGIEHEVQIFTVSEEVVMMSSLTAKEILAIDFMISE